MTLPLDLSMGSVKEDGKRLIEFAHLKNTCIDSEQNGYGKELSSILEAIKEQSIYPADELRQFFWDMFIADAFLGNFDHQPFLPHNKGALGSPLALPAKPPKLVIPLYPLLHGV